MSKLLRLLLVEDSGLAEEMILTLLRDNGYSPSHTRVENKSDMEKALKEGHWDIVLSDYHLPHFSAPEALEVLTASGLDIPCIVLSGTVGEEVAVDLLKAGASDFVPKDRPLRLVPAIERELREASIRQKRREADERIVTTLKWQQGINHLHKPLLAPGRIEDRLKVITDAVVTLFHADFCRIWITRPGDLCDMDCMHAGASEGPHVCRHRERCLHLVASSGRYTHLDGKAHRRVPFGCYKIGLIASGNAHKFLTNDVPNDSHIHNREWARELGLVSFAGYQLLASGGRALGVMALFSKHAIQEHEDASLDSLSGTVAQVIQQSLAENATRESEARFRTLFESSYDALMTLSPPSWKFTSANQATVKLFRAESEAHVTSLGPWSVSPEQQPDGSVSREKAPQNIMKAMQDGSHFFEWTHQRLDGSTFPATVLLTRVEWEGKPLLQATVRDISEQKKTEDELRKLSRALEQNPASVVITDKDGNIEYVNPKFEAVTGYSMQEVVGKNPRILKSGSMSPKVYTELWNTITSGREWHGELNNRRKSGELYWELASISSILNEHCKITHFIAIKEDITERKSLEMQLANAQKLESIGQLAAGIAHEINTPIQYIGDHARFLREGLEDLKPLNAKYQEVVEKARGGTVPLSLTTEVDSLRNKADEAYFNERAPKAIEQILEGVERVASIVRAMKDFSHPDITEKVPTDLNKAIQSTITVCRNEWKYVAEVRLELEESLPLVTCLPGEINQVVLNMVVNAAHAIGDAVAAGQNKGLITVKTRQDGDCAVISISDTGTGIPERHRSRIFEPFFTTKPVGKGTGQGLSISYNVVVKKHCGTLTFSTFEGKGTTFHIRLPILPVTIQDKECVL